MADEVKGRGAWAEIARKDAAVEPKVDIPSLLSVAGLKTVVIDANALIGGGVKLAGIADQFFTVREVLEEVRDPASRFHLATLPVTIRCLEPSEEALSAVIKFSRATGDFQSLSQVDLRLLALAYTLEAEVHGTAHIRVRPPPLVVTPSSTHRQSDPPGWGTVENPEEWEDLGEEESIEAGKPKSRILGLKPLNLESSMGNGARDSEGPFGGKESIFPSNPVKGLSLPETLEDSSFPRKGTQYPVSVDGHLRAGDKDSGTQTKKRVPKNGKPNLTERQVQILDGKVNVAEGIDASKGEVDEEENGWQRASCRTARRNYLKREAKRSARKQAAETANAEQPYSCGEDDINSDAANASHGQVEDMHLSRIDLQSRPTSADQGGTLKEVDGEDNCKGNRDLDQEDIRLLEDGDDGASIADDTASNDGVASSIQTDGVESEQSWMVGPMWKSSVACMTADYAMQNVILQIGLRLLSITGMHIRELNKWVLKCQACNRVTSDVGRIFCPNCGNGGTLFKLSVTVGQNGKVHAGRTRRINLRGTRYSLPMPKGGREGAVMNPILREDQLPIKVLHPRTKKATDFDNYSSKDIIFTIPNEKKGQKLAGVRTAAAIFGGRRNPNERRGARNH